MKNPKRYEKNGRAAFAAVGAGTIPILFLYGQELSTVASVIIGAAILGLMAVVFLLARRYV